MSNFILVCPHCNQRNSFTVNSLSNSPLCPSCQKMAIDGTVVDVDAQTFLAMTQSPRPVVAIFWSDNCAPCKAFKPVVEKMAKQRSEKIRFIRINATKHQQLTQRFRLRGVPSVLAFKKGKQQSALHSGLQASAFSRWLDENVLKN